MADQKNVMGIFKGLALVAQAGLSIALPLVFFIWLGQRLAEHWGAEGLFLILGIFLGLGTGFTIVYRLLFKEVEESSSEEENDDNR